MIKFFKFLIYNNKINNKKDFLYRDKDDQTNIIFKDLIFDNIQINDDEIIFAGNKYTLSSIFKGGLGIESISFIDCKFNNSTEFKSLLNYNYKFNNCEFNEIKFNKIKKKIVSTTDKYREDRIEFKKGKISSLIIKKSEFNGKFYINPQYNEKDNKTCEIDSMVIEETVFNENFKLHDCEIKSVNIHNTDFIKNADFFKSKFLQKEQDINFQSINFGGLALFGECKFHSNFIMEYVTITGLSHFREAEFFGGLNLDKSNIEKEMNFFNIVGLDKISEKNDTSQETYRILKYNCEKIGNIIEANKYNALELEKKKLKLEFNDNKVDWMIFQGNYLASRFGTNWVYPLAGILIVGFLTMIVLHHNRFPELLYSTNLINWKIFFSGLDKAFEYMYILNKDKVFEGWGFIFLVNKILLGYLYYQFVTAVRKDTRK